MADDNVAPFTITESGDIIPQYIPTAKLSGDKLNSGFPTTPNLARGWLKDTTLESMNNSLAHQCDFILDPKKNMALKEFFNSIANEVREAIKTVLRALGLDPTGEGSKIVTFLKSVKRNLEFIQRKILQPILNFEKYVIQYIAAVQQIIAYILSLPARLLAMLQDCLQKLYKLAASVMTDAFSGGSDTNGVGSFITEAKATVQTFKDTVNTAAQVVAIPLAVASSVSSLVSGSTTGGSSSATSLISATTALIKSTQPQYQTKTP